MRANAIFFWYKNVSFINLQQAFALIMSEG